ncbi:MAG: response regulator [Gorillibacterium sp.]|nr:response regulator [Gorillibacterium sp.]
MIDITIRVVAAEDEPWILDHLVKKIEQSQLGFEVVGTARNGQVALEQIRTLQPDVVFTDIKMPIMDGLDLAERIKDEFPHLPIIVLTGYSEFDYARKALQIGISDYLLKPLNQTELNEVLLKVRENVFLRNHELAVKITALTRYGIRDDKLFSAFENQLFLLAAVQLGNVVDHKDDVPLEIQTEIQLLWEVISSRAEGWFIDTEGWNRKIWILPCNSDIDSKKKLQAFFEASQRGHTKGVSICFCSDRIPLGQIPKIQVEVSEWIVKQTIPGISQIFPFPSSMICSEPRIEPATELSLIALMKAGSFSALRKELQSLTHSWAEFPQAMQETVMKGMLAAFQKSCGSSRNLDLDREIQKLFNQMVPLELNYYEFWSLVEKVSNIDWIEPDLAYTADQLEQYMNQHFTNPLCLTELGQKFNISPSYISHFYKKHKGVTPIKYLIQLRILTAKELIHSRPDLDFRIVSEMVGYADQHYFSRLFKSTTGITPSQFRNSKKST